eukprot:15152329-Alexandrium_andersonii.AAC.1
MAIAALAGLGAAPPVPPGVGTSSAAALAASVSVLPSTADSPPPEAPLGQGLVSPLAAGRLWARWRRRCPRR